MLFHTRMGKLRRIWMRIQWTIVDPTLIDYLWNVHHISAKLRKLERVRLHPSTSIPSHEPTSMPCSIQACMSPGLHDFRIPASRTRVFLSQRKGHRCRSCAAGRHRPPYTLGRQINEMEIHENARKSINILENL